MYSEKISVLKNFFLMKVIQTFFINHEVFICHYHMWLEKGSKYIINLYKKTQNFTQIIDALEKKIK